VYYRLKSCGGWIELKDSRHPNADIPFPNDKVGLHRSQIRWITEEIKYRGLVLILARHAREIYFIPGKFASFFNAAPVHRLRFFSALTVDAGNPGAHIKRIKKVLEGDYGH
jgi:hypothetical protein